MMDSKNQLGNTVYFKVGDGLGITPKEVKITATKWPSDDEIDAMLYAYNDVLTTQKYTQSFDITHRYRLAIQKVIFNEPATIVLWTDGSKTIVKCAEDEMFDAEKGFAIAVCKKLFGSDFKKVFKEFVPEESEIPEKKYVDDTFIYTKQQPSEGQKLFDAIKKLNEISKLKK